MQFHAIQCNAMQYNAMQYNAIVENCYWNCSHTNTSTSLVEHFCTSCVLIVQCALLCASTAQDPLCNVQAPLQCTRSPVQDKNALTCVPAQLAVCIQAKMGKKSPGAHTDKSVCTKRKFFSRRAAQKHWWCVSSTKDARIQTAYVTILMLLRPFYILLRTFHVNVLVLHT